MSTAIVANPYHQTPKQRDHADRMSVLVAKDPMAQALKARAIADDGWMVDLSGYAAQIGYVRALQDIKARLLGSALVPDCSEFAAAEIDLLARESSIDLGDET